MAQAREQARAAQSRYDKCAAEYEKKIGELQKALDSKQAELDRAASDSHQGDLEGLKKAVESERERADRAEGKARAAELLQEDLETCKGKVNALRRQLAVCSSLKDDLADAETKLAEATARASDAESRARAAERDSGRLSRELERVNLKLAEESSRAEGAKARLARCGWREEPRVAVRSSARRGNHRRPRVRFPEIPRPEDRLQIRWHHLLGERSGAIGSHGDMEIDAALHLSAVDLSKSG